MAVAGVHVVPTLNSFDKCAKSGKMLTWYCSAAVYSVVAFCYVHFVLQLPLLLATLEIVSRGRGYVQSTWPNHSPGSPYNKRIITMVERDT